jgi:hypothetical protein
MMETAFLSNSLHSLVVLTALLWFFSRPWKHLVEESARQILFRSRDQLFDIAYTKQLLDDPIYRELRNRYNNMIRFCHKLNWMMLLAGKFSLLGSRSDIPHKTVREILSTLKDQKLATQLEKEYYFSLWAVIGSVFVRSPLMMVVAAPFVMLGLVVAILSMKPVNQVRSFESAIEKDLVAA